MSMIFRPARTALFPRRFLTTLQLVIISWAPTLALAQEALEFSAAGPQAAAAAHRESLERPYNMKLGPVLFTISAGTGFEYNDNINLAEVGRESDFIIRPHIDLNAYWQVSQLNAFSLNLGLAYAKYLEHPDADTQAILISPGSDLSFDLYVGDFKFTFFDEFSIQQDPTQQIELANVINFTRFTNTAGVNGIWDLNDVQINLGYAFTIFRALDDDLSFADSDAVDDSFSFTNRNTHTVTGGVTFDVDPALRVGLMTSASFTEYLENFLNNNTMLQVGPFVEWQASPYITLRLQTGAQFGFFSNTGAVDDDSQLATPFAEFTLSHRLNPYVNINWFAGYTAENSLVSNYVEIAYVRQIIDWRIIKDVNLSTELFYENAHESGGILAENINRYGGSIRLSYAITQKLIGSLEYRHIERDSDVPLRDYSQNVILLDFQYQF